MSPRLERAKIYRARVRPGEQLRYVPCQSAHELGRHYGDAGHAVSELVQFAQGLGDAYCIGDRPTAIMLLPIDGEDAGAWADRCMLHILSWYRRHFDEAVAAGTSQNILHRIPKKRAA
jgi:hypothetical protein